VDIFAARELGRFASKRILTPPLGAAAGGVAAKVRIPIVLNSTTELCIIVDIVHDDAEDSLRGRGRATTAAALKLDLGPMIVCMSLLLARRHGRRQDDLGPTLKYAASSTLTTALHQCIIVHVVHDDAEDSLRGR
jgi:hypothetical protein